MSRRSALSAARVRSAWMMAAPMLLILLAVAGWPLARTLWLSLTDTSLLRIQPVDATVSLNISAGVLKPSVLRGLSFNCLAIAFSCSCE